MKKFLIIFFLVAATACLQQTVHQRSTFLDNHTFDDVWDATIKAVNDIKFTVDSVDRESGFIGAQRGKDVLQHAPPRLSIMITNLGGRVFVDCKVLQQDQFVDIMGYGNRTIRELLTALNANLNH